MQYRIIMPFVVLVMAAGLFSCAGQEKTISSARQLVLQDQQMTVFKYIEQEQPYWAVRTNATSRSGTFVVEVVVNRDLTVQEISIPSYPLSRGRGVLQPDFLSQFKTKTAAAPLRINEDIHAVTGATLSSTAVANTVRDILAFTSQHKDQLLYTDRD